MANHQGQLRPVLFHFHSQAKYITTSNCIVIWLVVFNYRPLLSRSTVKVNYHQNLITSRIHHDTYSHQVTSISDLLCEHT